jgi:ABC-2 type transport system permease protein
MFFYQLRNELWKLFGKKRTYIGFAMFLLAQLIIIFFFRYYPPVRRSIGNTIARNGFPIESFLSMLTIASLMATVLAYTLMPLYTALVGGDLVSKEAEDGTLRMILSRPISRMRLLCVKWLAGFVFCVALILALGLFGLVFSALWFPAKGGMFLLVPGEGLSVLDAATGLQHYAFAHVVLVLKAVTILSLAFMFSCFNMKPAAATILALSLIIIDRILMEIPYFADFRQWFLSYHLNCWQLLFAEHPQWWRVEQGVCVMFGFSLTFLVIGMTGFQMRDIKS